jgi:Glycosyltransferase like family 2
MNELAVSIFWGVVILTLFQILFTVPFANRLRRPKLLTLPSPDPQVTVILCLQGEDPRLSDCLHGVLTQDYPNYTLRMIAESRTDPSWDKVAALLRNQTAVDARIQVLKNPLDTCSVKCSSLIQAIIDLDPDCDIVALIEPDTVPHATWLRELVAPLADDRIGATSGLPWYLPTGRLPGTVIRYLWNATTVVMMYFNQIPWSGSIAFKTERLQETPILDNWHHALSDAVSLGRSLHKQKLRIEFVPSLMMVNASESTLADFIQWATQQMLAIRLNHPSWWGTVAISLLNSFVLGRAIVFFLITAFTGQTQAMAWIAGGLAVYVAVMAWLVRLLQQGVRHIMAAREQRIRSKALWTHVQVALQLVFLQWVQTLTLLMAVVAKTIQWRGTTYKIEGSRKIRLIRDRSYQPLTTAAKTF